MSSVPPSTQPASTPPSKDSNGPSDKNKKTGARAFSLPKKEVKPEEGMVGNPMTSSPLKGLEGEKATLEQAQATPSITPSASVASISKLIQRVVAEMQVGQQRTEMTLKSAEDVPPEFRNSHLSLSYENNGLAIHFHTFPNPQQANQAAQLISQHKAELAQMVSALQAKNIRVSELRIGDQTISLPRIEPVFSPLSPQAVDPKQVREAAKKVPKSSGPK